MDRRDLPPYRFSYLLITSGDTTACRGRIIRTELYVAGDGNNVLDVPLTRLAGSESATVAMPDFDDGDGVPESFTSSPSCKGEWGMGEVVIVCTSQIPSRCGDELNLRNAPLPGVVAFNRPTIPNPVAIAGIPHRDCMQIPCDCTHQAMCVHWTTADWDCDCYVDCCPDSRLVALQTRLATIPTNPESVAVIRDRHGMPS